MEIPDLVVPAGILLAESDTYVATTQALEHPECLKVFAPGGEGWWFDVRQGCAMLGARRVDDTLFAQLKAWLAHNVAHQRGKHPQRLVPSVSTIDEVCTVLAARNPRDAVEEYLRGLPKWDGVPRIPELGRAMGFSDFEGFEGLCLRKFLLGAVARALTPGCKVDIALVLIGAQGVGKSSSLRALFGDAHTHDSSVDFDTKDGAQVMGRAWLVELAELSALRKARDVESVKHFLSLQEDTFRPAYARKPVTIPRRAVCAGTTNDESPFVDATGNRRFLPVKVVRHVDLEWIRSNRDAVFAEIVVAFEAKETHWLSSAESMIHAEAASAVTVHDAWESVVKGREGSGELSITEIAQQWLEIEPRMLDLQIQRRLATILKACGMVRRHTRRGNLWSWPEKQASVNL